LGERRETSLKQAGLALRASLQKSVRGELHVEGQTRNRRGRMRVISALLGVEETVIEDSKWAL